MANYKVLNRILTNGLIWPLSKHHVMREALQRDCRKTIKRCSAFLNGKSLLEEGYDGKSL